MQKQGEGRGRSALYLLASEIALFLPGAMSRPPPGLMSLSQMSSHHGRVQLTRTFHPSWPIWAEVAASYLSQIYPSLGYIPKTSQPTWAELGALRS